MIQPKTAFWLKRALYGIAFAVWAYVMKGIWEVWRFASESLTTYLSRTLLIIIIAYVLLLLMEFWVDYEDLD